MRYRCAQPVAFCAPTHGQSYQSREGTFFVLGEAPGTTNEISFAVADLETLWSHVKDKVEVVNQLEKTPWGTSRFVIQVPDRHLLAIGQK
jgi:uncharacterized glyoxalase superfamily protein PhnB